MKSYIKTGLTVMLLAMFFLLSGFRAQTIIHDDGSETQDVLKVSDTKEGQKALQSDADEFQKRSYTIMDYSNDNGSGFRAMKTITKDGTNKSSVDRIVHKTHDGLICSTYYIDYRYDPDSIQSLHLGIPMEENNADLEYIVSFPSGTRVISNSTKSDEQGSTYLWSLKNSEPKTITLQATVWHKLTIYIALTIMAVILFFVLYMEHRRRNVISWKQAAHMRRMEMMLLCIPVLILGYMGYEYFVGTHVTSEQLDKVSQQQQEELLEIREEDKKIHDADARKKSDQDAGNIKSKILGISAALRNLDSGYQSGQYSKSAAKAEAQRLESQAKDLLSSSGLSQADKDVLQQLVDRVIREADDIGSGQPSVQTPMQNSHVSEEQKRADTLSSNNAASSDSSGSASTSSDNAGSSDSSNTAGSAAGNSGGGTSKPAAPDKTGKTGK